MDYDLGNKVFAVTGGSRGIGLAVAANLLQQGAKVAICARKQDGLDAALRELDAGDHLLAVCAHVAKEVQVERFFEKVIDTYGQLDGLINSVGMNILSSVVDADSGLWNKIIDSNLNGAFLCSRKAARIMREQRRGKIVNLSSLAARRSAPAMGIYGVAKAAIEMMTRVLAHELAAFGIQVNAVAPGVVRTPFSQPFWSDKTMHAQIVARIPLGRIAEPIDVVHPVLFLCSSGADFITGQTLGIDGGASVV